jgi:hypothetical protein
MATITDRARFVREARMSEDFKPKVGSVRGASYIDVANRVEWFLNDCEKNGWRHELIVEELAHEFDRFATFKATVTVFGSGEESGDYRVVKRATGHGSETPGDFKDYYEKAETKAIGRALGFLGYGTEAALNEEHMIVDSPRSGGAPAARVNEQRPAQNNSNAAQAKQQTTARNGSAISQKQIEYALSLAEKAGITPQELDAITNHHDGAPLRQLQMSQAKALIDALINGHVTKQTYRDLPDGGPAPEPEPEPEDEPAAPVVNLETARFNLWEAAGQKGIKNEHVEKRIFQLYSKGVQELTVKELQEVTSLIKTVSA